MFEKILSVKMDHRVSISSSNASVEWPIALNDQWRWKSKMKFEISKVKKLKSGNQKKNLSQKMFEKIISVKTDHRVSISRSNECIEWPIALNDHWR